jgi:hypothetical protein
LYYSFYLNIKCALSTILKKRHKIEVKYPVILKVHIYFKSKIRSRQDKLVEQFSSEVKDHHNM